MKLSTDIKPITHLKNHTAQVIRELVENRRPVAITQNGEARAVLLDVKTYDEWREALAMLKLVAAGEADIEAERTVDQDEAFARAQAALDRHRD